MKTSERIILVLLPLLLIAGAYGLYAGVQAEQTSVRDAVSRGEFERPIATSSENTENWREYYPVTVPIVIKETVVLASVADTLSERIRGLSETPYLPEGVVKLFAFGTAGSHSIWMKDMKYPLDIIWAAENGEIVHIEENVSPDSFPDSFSSPTPAWFVIEANAGFVASSSIAVGDKVTLPDPR